MPHHDLSRLGFVAVFRTDKTLVDRNFVERLGFLEKA
jgi:hypothetical protein